LFRAVSGENESGRRNAIIGTYNSIPREYLRVVRRHVMAWHSLNFMFLPIFSGAA